ncbi:MAG: Gfo/Idh/MocA family oxidoreductase [Saprospiraceae bacterium]|nr:Gfo/Idh/MocA family oxidoreductase [Saprospiraceae bacterium]
MKIGVLGTGHLGKIHLKCIGSIPDLELIGFYDESKETRESVKKEFDLKAFESVDELIDQADIVDIVTPTSTHYELAKRSMSAGKHVFIEKPVTETVEQARDLLAMQTKYGVRAQIGHVERYNPAYLALLDFDLNPMFMEGHRLSTFNPRGTDVSVVLDLMIHDLDLVLQLANSRVKDIRAKGVNVVSPSHDICNARLEFENGCVANLTASRISLKQMRKLRMFQNNAYVSIDMLEKQAQIITLEDDKPDSDMAFELDTGNNTKWVNIRMPDARPNNAIVTELTEFHRAIADGGPIRVSLEEGYSALSLAHDIIKACDA